jgi:hypothetical protein
MDLAKFLLMLKRRSLWFSRAAEFKDDPFAGFCFVEHRDIANSRPGWEELLAWMGTETAKEFREAPQVLFVNCWSLDPESNLMWKTYSKSGPCVAIVSSTHRYVDAIDRTGLPSYCFDCGSVVYHSSLQEAERLQHDFRRGVPMGDETIRRIVQLGFQKRDSFRGENEWRAVAYQDQVSDTGVEAEVDLDRLIDSVCVSPHAQPYFLDAVRAVVEGFSLKKKVWQSELLRPPQRPGSLV